MTRTRGASQSLADERRERPEPEGVLARNMEGLHPEGAAHARFPIPGDSAVRRNNGQAENAGVTAFCHRRQGRCMARPPPPSVVVVHSDRSSPSSWISDRTQHSSSGRARNPISALHPAPPSSSRLRRGEGEIRANPGPPEATSISSSIRATQHFRRARAVGAHARDDVAFRMKERLGARRSRQPALLLDRSRLPPARGVAPSHRTAADRDVAGLDPDTGIGT